MADKEIIINGVNVAGYEHFWDIGDAEGLKICKINFDNNYFSNGIPCGERCNKHPNCYYKQLQRKEQECEELKEKLNNIQDDCPSFGDCSYVQCVKDELNLIRQEAKVYKEELSANYETKNRYKQALEKIDGIVEDYDDWDLLKDIQTIINEVKE